MTRAKYRLDTCRQLIGVSQGRLPTVVTAYRFWRRYSRETLAASWVMPHTIVISPDFIAREADRQLAHPVAC